MVNIEMAKKKNNPNLSEAVLLYSKNARFCQEDPSNSHLFIIYKIRESMKKCDYLEIGTLFGFSMVNAINSKTKGKFVGVDLFEKTGKIGVNDYTPDIIERGLSIEKTKDLIEKCNPHKHIFSLIRGNSQEQEIYKQVIEKSDNFDFIFIDGDHSYDGCYKDFIKYSPLLRKNGYILFDDQDYSEIGSVIEYIKNNLTHEYKWHDWDEYSPKVKGIFQKIKE